MPILYTLLQLKINLAHREKPVRRKFNKLQTPAAYCLQNYDCKFVNKVVKILTGTGRERTVGGNAFFSDLAGDFLLAVGTDWGQRE